MPNEGDVKPDVKEDTKSDSDIEKNEEPKEEDDTKDKVILDGEDETVNDIEEDLTADDGKEPTDNE